jgi:GTP cyclohydrolase II
MSEVHVQWLSECPLPTEFGGCKLQVYGSPASATQWVACVWDGDASQPRQEAVHLRVHDACLTSEVLGSLKCDCAQQLRLSQEVLARQGGILIYTPQEGRGIGLAHKVAAYALQAQHGLDTVDANVALGLPAEARDYQPVRSILEHLGVRSVILLTNNPFKVDALRGLGVRVLSRRPVLPDFVPARSKGYLQAKAERMGHLLPEGGDGALPLQRDSHAPDGGLLAHGFDERCFDVEPESPEPEPSVLFSSTVTPPRLHPAVGAGGSRGIDDSVDRHAECRELIRCLRRAREAHAQGGAVSTPFVTLTYAQALDGSIAGPFGARGPRLMLSGDRSMELTHRLRAEHDAILVGVETLISDDPQLTVRLVNGPSPMRVVLDSRLRSPPHARAFVRPQARSERPHAVVVTLDASLRDPASAALLGQLRAEGVRVIGVASSDEMGRLSLPSARAELRDQFNIQSVMIEGGAAVIASCIRVHAANHAVVTLAPKMLVNGVRPSSSTSTTISDGGRSSCLRDVRAFCLGDDIVVSGIGPAAAGPAAAPWARL